MHSQYVLTDAGVTARRLASGWLVLGLAALLGAGVFSILLVASRTPGLQFIFPWVDFFHTALVVHVDLSVLVWFLAFGGVLWSLNSNDRLVWLAWAALATAAAGTLIMTLAPFLGDGHPIMSNYIPVLQQKTFLAGLALFGLGIVMLVSRSMTAVPRVGEHMSDTGALRFGLNATAVSAVMALVAFVWTGLSMPGYVTGQQYYELLFWGGGHILQFTYTLLMLVAWLWLASTSGVRVPISPRVVLLLFTVGLLTVFIAPIIYYSYPVASAEHVKLFSWLMQYGGSLATLPLGLALVYGLLESGRAAPEHAHLRGALWMSMLLFGLGGVIGFYIHGSNVIIPAHYHGSIVGVTLALMGVTYELLPRLGKARPNIRLARIQPWLYGGGQTLHVLGLLWSGGYGVQRKVAGADQALDATEKVVAMGLMGLGGLISIIGGLLFLYIVFRAWAGRDQGPRPTSAVA